MIHIEIEQKEVSKMTDFELVATLVNVLSERNEKQLKEIQKLKRIEKLLKRKIELLKILYSKEGD